MLARQVLNNPVEIQVRRNEMIGGGTRRAAWLAGVQACTAWQVASQPASQACLQSSLPAWAALCPSSPIAHATCTLSLPCPCQVGGRSVVNKDIAQFIEIRPEEERFLRLLEILGEW